MILATTYLNPVETRYNCSSTQTRSGSVIAASYVSYSHRRTLPFESQRFRQQLEFIQPDFRIERMRNFEDWSKQIKWSRMRQKENELRRYKSAAFCGLVNVIDDGFVLRC